MSDVLAPNALRRLSRFQARLEGAQEVLQAAEATMRALQENWRMAVESALEDADIQPPRDGVTRQLNIDWATGEVTFPEAEQAPNGVAR